MANEPNLTYKGMNIEGIIEWCKEHNEVTWLKSTAATKIAVYPKVENEKGKMVEDKSQKPIGERSISFMEIKAKFIDKFMPEIKPESKKKVSMYELIDSL